MSAKIYEVMVLGGGFAGIGAAIKLREAGIDDFILLEKANELGGVWRENTYPGCACDVPSALYSYSFEPNPNWSKVFAGQAEIKQYLLSTANKYGVMPHVRLQHEVISTHWLEAEGVWLIHTNQADFKTRFVIMACGPMHEPVIPDIPGLDTFSGEIFHSSRWRHDIDLAGKRVAVIGTGASAIQFVPEIQPVVKQLTVFQRTPQWVLPKMDPALPAAIRRIFEIAPLTQKMVRGSVYGIFETINGGMQSVRAMKQFQRLAQLNIQRSVKDPVLRQKLTPDYLLGCKRILQSNAWYPALTQRNVQVINHALQSVEGHMLVAADGSRHEVDTIILGTGFEIAEPPIAQRVYGRDGRSMAEVWQGSPEGYMGTMVAGCPNGFLMFGPNIAVSSSALIIIEAQLTYIVDALRQARARGIRSIEADPVRTAEYNQRVQAALQHTVWNTGGCQSYFIDRNGRNSTAWPWTTFAMRHQLSRFNLDEYLVSFQSQPVVAHEY